MSKEYIAVITIEDGYGFNNLRDVMGKFIAGTPKWVESMRVTEANEYSVPIRSDQPRTT